VQFDAEGDDRKAENLNTEWVEVKNSGNAPQDLSGWTLSDASNHTYTFPQNFVLGAGDSVKVRTGSGTDSTSDLYWGRGSPIWNNDGDTATLKDEDGRTVDSHTE
jgi:competence protein ComEC